MQQHRARIVDTNAEQKIALRCKTTGRLNARADASGIYLFCRQCNTQHLLSWADIDAVKQGIEQKTCGNVLYI